jgi:plasmid maintenance system killer protein
MLSIGLVFLLAGVAADPNKASDPKAVKVAQEVMEALGGEQAWRSTHFLRFDFAVGKEGKTLFSRSHTWDKWTGDYRLEGKTKEGKTYLTIMSLNTKDGKAYRDGKALEGEEKKKALEDAYGAWVNDTYWLLMPYKMQDPGVVLSYDGTKAQGKDPCDVVVLHFSGVGLTPKDSYSVWVNQKTHLVERWDYVLQGEKAERGSFLWTGWKPYGSVLLAPDREAIKGGTKIFFPVLEAPTSVPATTFQGPAN